MASKRSVVVTGGASGIGLGITKHFIQDPNTQITILDINPKTGAETIEKLLAEFPSARISFEECDVSSWESQASAFEKIFEQQGQIDIVFANAGITECGSLLPLKGGDLSTRPSKPNLATVNVNFVGVIYSVQLAIHYMARNKLAPSEDSSNGLIVCTASNAGLYPLPIAPLYAATKHGVIGLVRSLGRSLLPENIRINALAPAVVETNIASNKDLFQSMVITPMSTVTKAVTQLVDDITLTGKVAELHGGSVTFAEPPAYVDEDTGRNIETFWNLGIA
ncbi:uncharacterized protein N7483_004305 [Penicillium malachiteum]|uniref:uncharacterized protein n=1 Tax=Penicillium malachiteum TaxID=1324776 RepID=UPI00254803F5|nr:uncharacterized protein N7483_004305 [Penicillium malachiteum]KAJ5729797.1 hypothetical protein N7483_004305 [Penicillium malachiteum]